MTTSTHKIRTAATVLASLVALAVPAAAQTTGGIYTITGGTSGQQATVRAALNVTTFNWSCVPGTVRITIVAGADTQAAPGAILLDANLLDAGTFSWGIVQHEYAHQVDWYLLRPDMRTALAKVLGGSTWGVGITGGANVAHDSLTGERFASQLAYAFWPSTNNAIEPFGKLTPKAFRALLGSLLRPRTAAPTIVAAVTPIAATAAAPAAIITTEAK